MKKNLQAICGTLLIVCMIFLSGCGSILARKSNKNSTENTSSNEKPSEKPKGPKLAAPKPGAINITATELCKESERDKVDFERKYEGKNIAVTGRVSSMSLDEDVSVYLDGGGGDCNLIVCRFDLDQFENLVSLRKGKKVTLQGVGERFSVMPSLTECALQSLE